MKKQTEWSIEDRIPCECYTHEISVYADQDGNVELAYWQRGRHEQPWKWKTRIKMIWDVLTTGNPYADMIILNQENTLRLKNTLELILNKNKESV